MSKYVFSSPKNPCPICDRTKDGDCRIIDGGDGVLCHSLQDGIEGELANGYKYVKRSDRGAGWGVWRRVDGSKGDRKVGAIEKKVYYDYPDREGNALIRAVRQKGGKIDFWQEYFIDGEWLAPSRVRAKFGNEEGDRIIGTMRRRVPIYRYHEVKAAIDRGEKIYWCEGEKCADALWSIGIAATTSIGGSKSFKTWGDYSRDLEGAEVVIAPDRDVVGIAYSDAVCGLFGSQVTGWLYAYPDSPLWGIELPKDKGIDCADWVRDGATADDVMLAVEPGRRSLILPKDKNDEPLLAEGRSGEGGSGESVKRGAEREKKPESPEVISLRRTLDGLEGEALAKKFFDIAEGWKALIKSRAIEKTAVISSAKGLIALALEKLDVPTQDVLWKSVGKSIGVDKASVQNWVKGIKSGEMHAGFAASKLEQSEKKHKLVQDYEIIKKALAGRLAYNTLKNRVELDGEPFEVEFSKATLVIHYGLWLQCAKEDVSDLVMMIAKENTYNPIAQYLTAVHAAYGDDTSILYRFAERYFGQSDPIYTVFVIRFLIASVARIFEPGCKHDNALILQGGQGICKSTFFKVLASEAWFDDSLGGISDKDEKLKLHQTWFMEWAELETVFKRKDLSAAKAFLSSATDRIRPPYGKSVVEMPRRCSIVGTTNMDEFLNDVTGNRRFWVIPVNVPVIDIQTLAEERDRIWAAAVALYKAGEDWHLMRLEDEAAGEIAESFQSEDPWMQPIAQFVEGIDITTTFAVLSNALKIEISRQDKAAQMRAADILKLLGWKKSSKRIDGRVQRCWVRDVTTVHHSEKKVVIDRNLELSTLLPLFTTVTTSSKLTDLSDSDFEKTDTQLQDQKNTKNKKPNIGDRAVEVVDVVTPGATQEIQSMLPTDQGSNLEHQDVVTPSSLPSDRPFLFWATSVFDKNDRVQVIGVVGKGENTNYEFIRPGSLKPQSELAKHWIPDAGSSVQAVTKANGKSSQKTNGNR